MTREPPNSARTTTTTSAPGLGRTLRVLLWACLPLLAGAALGGVAAGAGAYGAVPLPGAALAAVPAFSAGLPAGASPHAVAASTPVTYTLEINVASTPQEQAFLNGLTDPSSPDYHQFETLSEFYATWGPSAPSVDDLLTYFVDSGFGFHGTGGPLLYTLTGTAAAADTAFHTTLAGYSRGSGEVLAPETAPSLPSSLAPLVGSVYGLNGFDTVTPDYVVLGPASPHALLIAPDTMQGFYDETPLLNGGDTGKGAIGVTELCDPGVADTQYATDLNTFDTTYGLATPTVSLSGDGSTTCSGGDSGWSTETELDLQWSHAMAPGATIDVCLDDANPEDCTQSFINASVEFISNSWTFNGETTDPVTSVWAAGKADGLNLFSSAGDYGTAVNWPAANPDGLGVGGTAITPIGNDFGAETTWSCDTNCSTSGGTGGGCDTADAPPAYQIGMPGYPGACASGDRGDPDVSMDAAPYTGVPVVVSGTTEEVGGTSLASPMWAASLNVIYQRSGFKGFGGAEIYALAKNATTYATDFHDITTGQNGPSASDDATAGWDPATGVGSPNIYQLAIGFVPPLSVTLKPGNITVESGATVAMVCTVSGGLSPYTYEWYLNGTPIVGAANASGYSFVPPAPAIYALSVKVTSSGSGVAWTNVTYITATPGPVAVLSFSPPALDVGVEVHLSAAVTGGSGSYTEYFWESNGTIIAQTTTDTATWTPTAAGWTILSVRVYDTAGGSGYSWANVTIYPQITLHLTSGTPPFVDNGVHVTLNANPVGGSPPVNYQFLQNGSGVLYSGPLSTYTWVPAHGGDYVVSVKATDAADVVHISNAITFTVNYTPSITLYTPPSLSLDAGQTMTLYAKVLAGTGPFDISWWEDGTVPLGNGTSTVYDFTPVVTGTYTINVTLVDRYLRTTVSNVLTLTVDAPPSVVIHGGSSVEQGSSLVLTAVPLNGIAPYTYVWSVNRVAQGGASSSTFSVPTNLAETLNVTVEIYDSSGVVANSPVHTVVVTASTPFSPIPFTNPAGGWTIVALLALGVVLLVIAVRKLREDRQPKPPPEAGPENPMVGGEGPAPFSPVPPGPALPPGGPPPPG